jgi:hypothetical protein
MKDFVNRILAPYFNKKKAKLNLPPSQKSLWMIDVWSVHHSKEFRSWMRTNHPNIILDFVPGGCTGVAQPCDVGIQRLFKLSLKRSYHEDVVNDIVDQLKAGNKFPSIDTRLAVIRDQSVRWLWNAYQSINNVDLVKKVSKISIYKKRLTYLLDVGL